VWILVAVMKTKTDFYIFSLAKNFCEKTFAKKLLRKKSTQNK